MTATALVLAAGKGTRMRSALAKVLHPLCGRPMAGWVLEACREAGLSTAVVVGHQADAVRRGLGDAHAYALQAEQNGTGHAVACASSVLPPSGVLVVLPGDAPLIEGDSLAALVEAHRKAAALCTVLTMQVDEPGAYGRIVRGESGQVQRIVEAANASRAELALDEVNSGIYAFDAGWLLSQVIPQLKPHPPKGELYLTDAIEQAALQGRLAAHVHPDPDELMGVNDKAMLAQAEARLRERINLAWMREGVTMRDPSSTYVDALVELGRDVVLEPGVVLKGRTTLEEGVRVGAHSVLSDTRVREGAVIQPMSCAEGADIGRDCQVGPYARLRQGSVLGAGVKVGNFVETKKAVLHRGAKASHLAYLGDCEIGAEANIGAGTITCNYDGWGKHKTTVGERAFIGSNSALVAPVEIGADSIVGAGSTITSDVPRGDLSIARGRQKNIGGAARDIHARNKKRAGK
jgi:bifunctional UDP-N-acetylglucosamine pyrophosphorylase/glucosamine-1-phosphate N-acetyltransferase